MLTGWACEWASGWVGCAGRDGSRVDCDLLICWLEVKEKKKGKTKGVCSTVGLVTLIMSCE